MESLTAMEVRKRLGDILSRVFYGGERFVINKRGRPLAALISVEDLHRLETMEDERDAELLRLAKQANQGEEYVGANELIAAYERRAGKQLSEDV